MLLIKQKLPKQVTQILRQQVGLALFLSLLCLIGVSKLAAVSLLVGAVVCILSSFVFARTLFRFNGAQQSKKIVRAFYLGECYKILSSAVLFFLIFNYLSLNNLAFWLGFILAQSVFWIALANNKPQEQYRCVVK